MSGFATSPVDTAEIVNSARAYDPDRYLSALLAPAAARQDLITLAAFTGEIANVARQVRDPTLGEIRLRWWRDGLADRKPGQRIGHPVADAFAKLVARRDISKADVDDYLEVHAHRLFAAPPADDAALDLEMRLSEGLPFRFAAQILAIDFTPDVSAVIDNAARAYGLALAGLNLPYSLARGRSPLPTERVPEGGDIAADWRPQIAYLVRGARAALAETSRGLEHQPRAVTTALLPVALVGPYLKALQSQRHSPSRDIAQVAPLIRVWRLARAHWLRRI